MAQKKDSASPDKINPDLRFKTSDEPLDSNAKRFDIFLIDTGWNSAVAKVVRAHLATIFQFEKQDAFYLLSPEQSVEIIRRAPHLIGHDPIMLVYDHYAPSQSQIPRLSRIPTEPGPDQASRAGPGAAAGISPLHRRQPHRGPHGPRDPPRTLSRRIRWFGQDPP